MWLEFMTKWLGGRAARRMGTGVLIVSMAMATGAASAKVIVCPPSIAPQPNIQARVMALKDIQALPNKPDPKVEGLVVVTEGYLIRAISIRPTVSRCGARVERSYRLRLLPKKPSSLKGRFSFRHAVVATVPARLVEGRVDANGAPIALVGKRVRLSGMLTFAATSKEKLNKTQGTLWELVAVSHITSCPTGACPATGP
ncbi:hypothetical protein [Magnetospirillum sp. 15-1]|uniref:hypothetical protein n=1 Tax=Magnetospirillum sp. 15-1 TaxID=1979370 RepID=UPI001143F229|nr:hypothetical protein [Magnetospirillum sp. 15-1]